MELTPEERQRIYLEEKARLEAQREAPGKAAAQIKPEANTRRIVGRVGLGIVGLLVFAVIVWYGEEQSKSQAPVISTEQSAPAASTARSSAGETTIRLTCYCALSYDDVFPVLEAYAHNDAEALYGLLSRGKAIELKEGTRVYAGSPDRGGAVRVSIESGFHSGESCYVRHKFVGSY